jgi:hypothetical protein
MARESGGNLPLCGKSGMARMLSEMYATLGSPFLVADILISLPNATFTLRIEEEEEEEEGISYI